MMWNKIERIESKDSNDVAKFVFTKDNAVAESVLYKYEDYANRTVICCSTQSGCQIGCRFCGAGDYFVRSLTTEEIVSQPEYLLTTQIGNTIPDEIDRLQIMFMSMGEPLMNTKNLIPALRILYNKYPKAALLISTSGPKVDYNPIIEISKEIPNIGLQFSVHESTDEQRNKLIPFKNKLTLAEIANIGVDWCNATGRKPFFNYCVHENNNKYKDVINLKNLFHPMVWNATISVICERGEHMAAANIRQKELADNFRQLLMYQGYNTRVFNPQAQDDIGGGCGQLWFVQEWMRNNPDKARPSIGNGLPVLHTPNER